MARAANTPLLIKTFVLGVFIAVLIYFFHPDAQQFSVTINGQPVAEPLARFAAFPTLLIIAAIIGILMLLAFFGVGMFLFLMVLGLCILGVFIIAPYFWPLLLIICLVIIFSSYQRTPGQTGE